MTQAHSDAFFRMGRTHTICQDYTRAGVVGPYPLYDEIEAGAPFAVLCDGCSSSEHTDIGARILVSATSARLASGQPFDLDGLPHKSVLHLAQKAVEAIGLKASCLDATLLIAERQRNYVRATVIGDGAAVVLRRNGDAELHVIEHPHNAPFYPSYRLDLARHGAYLSAYPVATRHRVLVRPAGGTWRLEHEGDLTPPQNPLHCWPKWPEIIVPRWSCQMVMLLSDGAASFLKTVDTGTSKIQEPVPLVDVVSELLNIKSFTGPFLQRRCQAFLDRFCVANRWQHADDFSAAAIYMPEAT